jgi:hypothetical protein
LAQKLEVPFTSDLLTLGSNSAISDALIEKAVAAGKSVAQINAAMSTLWAVWIYYVNTLRYYLRISEQYLSCFLLQYQNTRFF